MIAVSDILQKVPKHQQLIVFYSSSPTFDDGFGGGRVFSLGQEFVRAGAVVITVLPTKEHTIKLQIFFDKFVIHICLSHFSDLLTHLARRCGKRNVFISSASADVNAFSAIQRLKLCNWCTLYDMSHDLEDMHRLKLIKSYSFQVETAILKSVQGIVVVGEKLRERAMTLGVSGDIILVPNASTRMSTMPFSENEQNINSSHFRLPYVVGYFGSLNPVWLDWSALIRAAYELRSVRFEVVGDHLPAGLNLPENIKIISSRRNRDIKKIISGWSIALLPVRKSLLSMSLDLIVGFEYLAMGIGVIASREGPMIHKGNAFIYDGSASGLRDTVAMALNGDLGFQKSLDNSDIVHWNERAATLIEFINEIDT